MTTAEVSNAFDEAKLESFVGRFVQDLGAVGHAATVLLGDRLGLYRAMADSAWVTPDELAARTGTEPRHTAEWLAAQTASGYTDYDPPTGRFRLPPEHAFTLTSEDNPVFVPGGLQVGAAMIKSVERVAEGFRTGEGLPWGAHDPELFVGTERFFRPGYSANLTTSWIPALEGVHEALHDGALVADVGCGHGASTVIMAQAYPASRFVGLDPHPASVEAARRAAAAAGVERRCTFDIATAADFEGRGFALVALFDSLHDMGDPVRALAHIRGSLAPGGSVMLVEPNAQDRLEDNINPIGRTYYSGSTMLCVPNAMSQHGEDVLGAQAGEARLREVAAAAGFARATRVAETPFNIVLQLQP